MIRHTIPIRMIHSLLLPRPLYKHTHPHTDRTVNAYAPVCMHNSKYPKAIWSSMLCSSIIFKTSLKCHEKQDSGHYNYKKASKQQQIGYCGASWLKMSRNHFCVSMRKWSGGLGIVLSMQRLKANIYVKTSTSPMANHLSSAEFLQNCSQATRLWMDKFYSGYQFLIWNQRPSLDL